jgi:transcriptional regulator NrdR family protein
MKRLDSPDCECPAGKGSMVVETRMDTRYGFGWRRRLCLGCGHSFGTYEIPDSCIDIDQFTPINPDGKLERK